MKKWPLHNAWFWESAPFFRVLLPIVAGIVCYAGLQQHIPVQYILAVAFISFSALVYTLFSKAPVVHTVSFVAFNIAVIAGIYSICWFSDARNITNPIGTDTTGNTLVRVASPIVVKEKTTRLIVQAIASITNKQVSTTTGSAYIYTYNSDAPVLNQGDTLLIPNHWQPITNRGNPFEYDYAAYCARNNLYYRQFLGADDVQVYGHTTTTPGIIAQSHNWCMQQLAKYIPDAEICGLMQAMLLGDETNLDDNLRQAWAQTGIMHFIAISGGNITMFFFIIAALLSWLRHRKHLWVKYIAALPLVWLYVAIAGAPPSAVRAAIMFSIVAISLVLQKNNNNLNTLFATAVLLLVAQPMWLYSAGFQLSFVAILSLILFYGRLYALYTPQSWLLRKLWQTLTGSLAVEILVAPLIIRYFYLFPLPFLISNLLAFLFMNIVLALGMAILAFVFLPIVATAAGWLVVWLTTGFNNIIYSMQNLNPLSFNYLYLSGWELVGVYIIITGLALFVLRQQKPGLFLSLSGSCALLILLCADEYTALQQQRFVAYNMGDVNQMELTNGKSVQVINTDIHTLSFEKDHTLKPAHAAWRAWQVQPTQPPRNIFLVNGKSILLLDKPISTGNFSVDYLVVNLPPGKVHPATLMQVFHPHVLIFGSNYSTKQAAKWLLECQTLHIPAWHTGTQGAFVLGS